MTHTILIVDRDPEALAFNVRMLSGAGYRVVIATSFEEASSRLLASKPDVLIADIRLDAYNGLHLVFRARDEFPHIVALVTDSSLDPVLQADAAALGVVYLVKPLDADTLLPVLETRLRDRPDTPPPNSRRWPRKRTGRPYSAVVGTRQAQVVEISYGGLRLETTQPVDAETGSAQTVDLPAEGLAIHARSVWTRRLESGKSWSGVEVDDTDPVVIDAWRRFVDKN